MIVRRESEPCQQIAGTPSAGYVGERHERQRDCSDIARHWPVVLFYNHGPVSFRLSKRIDRDTLHNPTV